MALAMALLLSGAVLLLAPGIFSQDHSEKAIQLYPVKMTVYDTINSKPNATYTTSIPYKAVLLGAMKRAQKSSRFRFVTKDNPDYGPFLESINGVKGNTAKHTYWEILIQPKNSTVFVSDVGVGCYIPAPDDHIIFKFTKW